MTKEKAECWMLILCACLATLCACTTGTDYLVRFRSKGPFYPHDGSELVEELRKELLPRIVIKHFFFNQRKHKMRGSVLVEGRRARDAVLKVLRHTPGLGRVITQKARAGGKSLICFSSHEAFNPSSETEFLSKLRADLPDGVKLKLLMTRPREDRMVGWVITDGNFSKEAVKFALRQSPDLALLQVEQ